MEFTFDLFKNPEQAKELEDAYQTYISLTSSPDGRRDAETKIVDFVTRCCAGASWKRGFVDEQKDFIQDVLLQIFSSLPTFRGECPFVVWVSRIIQNKGHDLVERLAMRRQKERSLPEKGTSMQRDIVAVSVPDRGGQVRAGIDREKLLQGLKLQDRQLLELRLLEEMRFKEIGSLLGMPEETARRRFNRLRKKLRGADFQKTPRRTDAAIHAALVTRPSFL